MGDVELLTYEPISSEVEEQARQACDEALRRRALARGVNPEVIGLASMMVSRDVEEGERWIRFLSTDGQTWFIPVGTDAATDLVLGTDNAADVVAIAAGFGEMLANDVLRWE